MADNLTPEERLAARVLDVLDALSEEVIAGLRREARENDRYSVAVPRRRMRELVAALDVAYPNALDMLLSRRRMKEQDRG
jgi:hypothetical protein